MLPARAASSPHGDASFNNKRSSNNKTNEIERNPVFECNICLDTVTSPVVTYCGHLYCWPCIYQWMGNRSECPVCKAGISEENVIPVYARGTDAVDSRTHDGIPERPRGQRLDAHSLYYRRLNNPRMWDGSPSVFTSSPTLGFFPAFFGGGFHPSSTRHFHGTPLTPQEQRQQMQQAFLSRLLLIIGSLVLLCLLTF